MLRERPTLLHYSTLPILLRIKKHYFNCLFCTEQCHTTAHLKAHSETIRGSEVLQ